MKEEILELLNRDPFVPFKIELMSGDRHQIDNPNLVAVGESTIHVMTPKSDRYVIIRLNQIVSTEVLEPAG